MKRCIYPKATDEPVSQCHLLNRQADTRTNGTTGTTSRSAGLEDGICVDVRQRWRDSRTKNGSAGSGKTVRTTVGVTGGAGSANGTFVA